MPPALKKASSLLPASEVSLELLERCDEPWDVIVEL
jgi:hypothetical protein